MGAVAQNEMVWCLYLEPSTVTLDMCVPWGFGSAVCECIRDPTKRAGLASIFTAYVNLSLGNTYYFLLPNIGLFIDNEFILLEGKVNTQMSGFNGSYNSES